MGETESLLAAMRAMSNAAIPAADAVRAIGDRASVIADAMDHGLEACRQRYQDAGMPHGMTTAGMIRWYRERRGSL